MSSAVCITDEPGLFGWDDEGVATGLRATDDLDALLAAADRCPVAAISVRDRDGRSVSPGRPPPSALRSNPRAASRVRVETWRDPTVSPTAPRTMADVLARLDHPELGLTFVRDDGRHALSFSELDRLTADVAARWSGLGLARGDRVVVVVADEHEFALAFLSALRAGVVPVPMFPPFVLGQLDAYGSALARSCRVSGARACLVSGLLVDLVAPYAPTECAVVPFADLTTATPGAVDVPHPDDTAFVQFSSGSTRDPQGSVITHRALLANAHAIAEGLALSRDDRAVSWLPMYHDMGLIGFLVVPLVGHVPTWYLPPLRFARDPMAWLRLMSEVRASIAFAPNFAYGLLARRAADDDLADLDLSCWRVAGCGAEPVRAETLRTFAERFADTGFDPGALMPSYGLAESTLAVALGRRGAGARTVAAAADVLERSGRVVAPGSENGAGPGAGSTVELVSCGPPVTGTEVRVLGPEGDVLPDGREGEIAVRGPSLADGYIAAPAATAETWLDGWLHTGDTGVLLDGELYVTGRIKDLIVVHGRNLHPQDIEWSVGRLPGVRTGAVVALPVRADDTEGVRVVCEIAGEPDQEALVSEVRRSVRNEFGVFVTDVVVLPRDGIPKTTSGKLRRGRTADVLGAV